MQNKKLNGIIMGCFIGVIVLFCVLYFIFNYTKDDNSLSIVEKKWITDNVNNVIDINIYNDIPIYGYNGNGIIFDYLESFTDKYNINFNKISYHDGDNIPDKDLSFKVLDENDSIGSNDILFYQDDYCIVSLKYSSLDDLSTIDKIGVLKDNYDTVLDYFGEDNKNIFIESYDNMEVAVKALENGDINYFITPNIMNMKEILNYNLNIIYHVDDLNKRFVLTINNDTIYKIMSKYFNVYMDNNFDDDYSKQFLDIYFNFTKTDSIEIKNYNGKVYKYGYIVNMPYENYSSSKFVGTISNYLSNFESISDVEIEVVRYDSIDEIKKALINGNIDFALTNFDGTQLNMESINTVSFKNQDYVVLSDKNIPLSSIKGLRGEKVSVIGSSNLSNLCSSNGIDVNIFSDTNDLIRNINNEDIIILDKETYLYYKNGKLGNYKVIYEDSIEGSYRFIVNANNKTFANMFNYYISSNSYNKIRYDYNTDIMIKEENNNLLIAVLGMFVLIIILVVLLLFNKKKHNNINISRDDMVKFIDPMTSLKNRNYLNHNIYTWDDNVIFPQSVIVMDVNKLGEINDTYGREVGDEVIKKVASNLINNQLENTDIVRSGGDEFLIYMIGYEEKAVVDYMKKMVKIMKNIPDSYGVEAGYSMILDEVKTVDDAINESIVMMKKNKEKNRNRE